MFEKYFALRTKFMRASEIRELLKVIEKRRIISLAGGFPDPHTFPIEDFYDITDAVLKDYGTHALQYSVTRGVSYFRHKLIDFAYKMRGIKVKDLEYILVLSGSQQGLDIIARTLINPGDYVVVELPTYLAALNAFNLSAPNYIGIPMDDYGMRVDILEDRLRGLYSEGKRVKLVYTVPIAHNPAGVTMSYDRRKYLIELASQYDFLVVEDDPYSYLVFENVDVTPLKALDKEDRVIYLSTFSKILAPGLRLGWLIAHPELTDIFERCKQSLDLHTPTFSQYIAAEAIKRGIVDKVIAKAKAIYKRKRDAMLDALVDFFPKNAWWSKPIGGMFVFARLPWNLDTKALLPEAIEKGVAYVPGQSFFVDGSGKNTLRLNFSYPSVKEIRSGIEILGKFFREKAKELGLA